MSIKTLHLTNWWAEQSGGIATFYRELLKAAERARRHIRLVVPGAATLTEKHGEFGIIYHVAAPRSPVNPIYRMLMPGHYLAPRGTVRQILMSEQADLVECCDKYTLNYLAALLRRGWLPGSRYRPAVVGLSCERMDENVARYISASRAARAFCRFYMKWMHFPMFDHHIAVSDVAAEELRLAARGHFVRRGVWVCPMGVDCEQFRPERRTAVARRWIQTMTGAPDGARLVLYVGRLAPEKNLALLTATMARLEQETPGAFHLVVAGEGPARAHLEHFCSRNLPAAVWFLGHVEQRQTLADLYANCDVFLHPNPNEPYGLAPLEAMASGLPLVAPDSGGVTTFASPGNAWLAKPDAASFEQAIRAVDSSPESEAKLVAARSTARQYDWHTITSGYFEVYEEVHALVFGRRTEPRIPPAFFSTAGNRFGWEIR